MVQKQLLIERLNWGKGRRDINDELEMMNDEFTRR